MGRPGWLKGRGLSGAAELWQSHEVLGMFGSQSIAHSNMGITTSSKKLLYRLEAIASRLEAITT